MLEIAGGIILAVLFFVFLPFIFNIFVGAFTLLIGITLFSIAIFLLYSYPLALLLLLVPGSIIFLDNYFDSSDKTLKELNDRKRKGKDYDCK